MWLVSVNYMVGEALAALALLIVPLHIIKTIKRKNPVRGSFKTIRYYGVVTGSLTNASNALMNARATLS